jgi:hypothetical protein
MDRLGFYLVVLVLVFGATSVHSCRITKRNEVEQVSNAVDDTLSAKDKNDVVNSVFFLLRNLRNLNRKWL